MVEYFFEYAQYADKVRNGCGYGFEYLFAGEAAFYREDMAHAAKMFNSAIMKARLTGQHDILCNALWNLGRIEMYYGNHKKALARLDELVAHINDNHLVQLYELRDCLIFWFYCRLGDLAKIPSWFANTIPGPENMPISMARKQVTGVYYLYLTGDKTKSYATLLQLESLWQGQGRWAERLCLYILKALLHMDAAEPEPFASAFKRAYDMVYANNLKYCMSGYGKEMVAILDYLKKQGISGYDREWLDAVYRDAVSTAKRLQVMQAAYKNQNYSRESSVSLTKRENETLHFLAQGLTQKEIGRLMGISENAVKKHISKIYFKLGAVNRADAIHIATMNGLVDVINN
ncbi:LuxR C-terminal-related transcriptional regulator, partial [Ruminococcaceae bacterium OttesenSCG-928-D13]|nr:LuxR C-terminal-related transcriptional regulator [Ruminococcaceae bacterium OttesenSCG-928-D13]